MLSKQPVENPREQAILVEIIHFYLERDEAISARTLSKISRLSLSPTTIRNLMEDLSHEGFLTTEGVSRGRIPTQKAFAAYVSDLAKLRRAPRKDSKAMEMEWKEQPNDLWEVLDRVGRQVAERSGFIVVCSLPEKEEYPLDWVRLVPVDPGLVLVAVRSLFGDLWCKVLEAADPFPEEVLREVESYICRTYHARPVRIIRTDIMAGMPKDLLENIPSLGSAFRLLRNAFDWREERGWHVWGRENLYQFREMQQPEQILNFHRALDDTDLLTAVLAGGRQVEGSLVAIGTETGYPGLETSSVVAFPFSGGDGWKGTIAVLGPMRMDYSLVFQLVSQAAATLEHHLRALSQRPGPCD